LKNDRDILYRALEKAAPVTAFDDKVGKIVEILYSTDSLKRFNMVDTTIGKLKFRLRVKKIGSLKYWEKLFLS
jgi:hypothetical protein